MKFCRTEGAEQDEPKLTQKDEERIRKVCISPQLGAWGAKDGCVDGEEEDGEDTDVTDHDGTYYGLATVQSTFQAVSHLIFTLNVQKYVVSSGSHCYCTHFTDGI